MSAQSGLFIEDISVGQSADYRRTVSEADISAFAEISGDRNPVHLDQDYAEETMFKGRIAHGMLSGAYISTVIGMKLPGPGAIYMSQSLRFRAPVRIGDEVVTTCTVTEVSLAKKRITLECVCQVGETKVVTGEALVMVPSRVA